MDMTLQTDKEPVDGMKRGIMAKECGHGFGPSGRSAYFSATKTDDVRIQNGS